MGTLLSVPAGSSAAPQGYSQSDDTGCPGHECRNYNVAEGCRETDRAPLCHRAADPDGMVRIHYMIYPVNPFGLAAGEIRRMVAYHARTWEFASPVIRFVFDGFTDRPSVPGDGTNTVAFQMPAGAAGAVWGPPPLLSMDDTEWDMWLSARTAPAWVPCRFDCYPVPWQLEFPDPSGRGPRFVKSDIGSTITHEWGHVLGMGHPDMSPGSCVTMESGGDCWIPSMPRSDYYTRHRQSLSMAEYLGMKVLYPYTCPKPPKRIKNPSADRSWLPWRYQRVCPSIHVAIP